MAELLQLKRRGRLWRRAFGFLAACAVAMGLGLYAQRAFIVGGAEAYLYGYPLVMVDITRAHAALTVAAENQLHRVRQFPDAQFRAVVRPNVDTLYTTAFIDTAQGPWLFEMPANAQRYEVMPFMDAWTNVFAAPGTRTTGVEGGRYLLVGPGWTAPAPQGLRLLRSPTRIVWLIGRTQTDGPADYPLVHRLQDGLVLRRWGPDTGATNAASAPGPLRHSPAPLPPIEQVRAMGVDAFFTRLAELMVDNPPAAADGPMLELLARLGVAPGQPPRWGPLDRGSVALGRWLADVKVSRELKRPGHLVRGWSTPPAAIGQYGTQYKLRAVVAMIGLGANLPADAMYPSARVDAAGEPLHGKRRYRLHFKAGELPPVHSFWSITAYGPDDFLIDNPLGRYALGNRDPLVFNADGSLDLWVQAAEPPASQKANWLPVAAGERFLLNARLYWPQEAALDGRWGMPAIERLD